MYFNISNILNSFLQMNPCSLQAHPGDPLVELNLAYLFCILLHDIVTSQIQIQLQPFCL